MKKLLFWLLLINGSIFAMCCWNDCDEDDELLEQSWQPLQKPLWKTIKDTEKEFLYEYDSSCNRWKLIRETPHDCCKLVENNPCGDQHNKESYIERHYRYTYYVESKYYGQADVWEIYEVFNKRGFEKSDRTLLKVLTLDQYHELDLKENGQFVMGTGE